MEVRTSLAERFLNWMNNHSRLYFRKRKGEPEGGLDLQKIHFDEIGEFFHPLDRELAALQRRVEELEAENARLNVECEWAGEERLRLEAENAALRELRDDVVTACNFRTHETAADYYARKAAAIRVRKEGR